MWILAFAILLIVGFAIDRMIKRLAPSGYSVLTWLVWGVEGLLFAIAIGGLIYHLVVG